jgi:hypothetical protein
MNYDVDDLLDAEAAGELKDFFDQHRGLHRLGLSILKRWAGDSVRLSVAGSGFQILGFTSLLEGAIAQNAAKLGEARPRETHLAVLVFRWDLSDDPTETPPPTLPEEVDGARGVAGAPRRQGVADYGPGTPPLGGCVLDVPPPGLPLPHRPLSAATLSVAQPAVACPHRHGRQRPGP